MIPDDDDDGHDDTHDDAHDDGGQNDASAGDGAGFADLVGETRPLKDGAPRVPPVTPDPVRKQASLRGRDAAQSRFRWPDPEQPLLAAGPGVSDQQLQELARGEPAPEEQIDLHGVRADAAQRLLAQRVESARARGLRCVVLIHGQGKHSQAGQAVLRERVPNWLSKPPLATSVLAFAPAPRRLGGAGATLVLLRRN
jgi:DNA-nicking Smr family endonuclease